MIVRPFWWSSGKISKGVFCVGFFMVWLGQVNTSIVIAICQINLINRAPINYLNSVIESSFTKTERLPLLPEKPLDLVKD